MKLKYKIICLLLVALDFILLLKIVLGNSVIAILNPKGLIALQERNLMISAILIMLVAVIPVFLLAIYVAKKYRAGNTKTTYAPDWDSPKLQILFWGFLILIMATLSVITWISAHQLDPHIAITSNTKPLTIQVVALRWKWLFIYPEQNIATVNYLVFPEKTPVKFEITAADSPMNSFWIPQLGGQIYAMSGMATQTHLIADGTGEYRGSTAEISGAGFAGMTFSAKSVSQNDFDLWVNSVKKSPKILDLDTFNALAKPSEHNPLSEYSSTEDNLYTTIVMKYMAKPKNSSEQTNSTEKMQGM